MEVKEKSKKRELIKTIAIIFLVILLILTFFSQTIMNYSLPEVSTQLVSSGTINPKIRGNGTLTANESYEVILKQTREVRSVCVKVGDKVEQGDLLFVLGDVESEELKTAQDNLDKLRIDYQKRVLELSKGYATDDQSVKAIREDLERAYAQRDANKVTDEEVSFAKGDLATAKNNLSQIEFTLKELNALQTENEEYANAKAEVSELETKVKTLTTTLEGFQDELEKLDSGADVSDVRKVQDAQAALEKAQTKWRSDWGAYEGTITDLIGRINTGIYLSPNGDGTKTFDTAAQIAIESKLREWQLAIGSGGSGPGSGDSGKDDPSDAEGQGLVVVQSADGSVDAIQLSKWNTAYTTLLADQQDVEAKTQALQRLQQDSSISSGTVYEQRRTIQNKIDETNIELSAAQQDLRSAQQRMENASSNDSQLKAEIRSYEASQRAQQASITALEGTLAELQEKQTAYKTALETVASKERELATALSGKDFDKQLNNLDLQAMSLEIEKQQELVDKYQKDSVDAEILSKVSGVISAINVTAGKDTTPDQAMAVIDVVDQGYIIKVPVTNEQAKQVKVGDSAEVTNYRWGGDIKAVLESIAPDPSSGGQKKLLIFRVSGDVEAGANISLSIGQRSTVMDTIVPKSAIREDANGKFVLVVTARSTPLGNRYTATRAEVQILGEDDTSAAVSGLAANDYVITTSSKPLDPGSQVRMVENP